MQSEARHGKEAVTFELPAEACTAVELYLRHARPVLLRHGGNGSSQLLLLNTRGDPFTCESFSVFFTALQRGEKAPWEPCPYAQFRRGYAAAAYEKLTLAVAAAAPAALAAGAAAMGHTVRTQQLHYAGDREGQLMTRAAELAAAAAAPAQRRGAAACSDSDTSSLEAREEERLPSSSDSDSEEAGTDTSSSADGTQSAASEGGSSSGRSGGASEAEESASESEWEDSESSDSRGRRRRRSRRSSLSTRELKLLRRLAARAQGSGRSKRRRL
jgi:hypothetical protein